MKKGTKKTLFVLVVILLLFVYYQLDYKRHFISNKDGSEYITIWTSSNNECFIIPYKYYSPFSPKANFIKTVNHRNYIGVVWDTKDTMRFKISIYNDYEVHDLEPSIKVYNNNNILLKEYNILRSIRSGEFIQSDSARFQKRSIGYEYIDLNRIWGIKRFKW